MILDIMEFKSKYISAFDQCTPPDIGSCKYDMFEKCFLNKDPASAFCKEGISFFGRLVIINPRPRSGLTFIVS